MRSYCIFLCPQCHQSSALSPIPEISAASPPIIAENTLNIVGICTPIISNENTNESQSLCGTTNTKSGTHQQKNLTIESGMAYTMSDMTFSSIIATYSKREKPDNEAASVSEDGLAYTLSDMTLSSKVVNCDIHKSTEQEAESTETDNGLAYTLSDMTFASKINQTEALHQLSSDNKNQEDKLKISDSSCVNGITSTSLHITETSRLNHDCQDKPLDSGQNSVKKCVEAEIPSPVNQVSHLKSRDASSFATPDIFLRSDHLSCEDIIVESNQPTDRRESMIPMHVSTPLSGRQDSYRKNKSKKGNQENVCPIKKETQPTSCTPLSAIPSWHKKRILVSSISNSPNKGCMRKSNSSLTCPINTPKSRKSQGINSSKSSQSCVSNSQSITHENTELIYSSEHIGLTTMFDEAELLINSPGIDILPSADREELNKILLDFDNDARSINLSGK